MNGWHGLVDCWFGSIDDMDWFIGGLNEWLAWIG